MEKTTTQNDLIKFLYDDVNEELLKEINNELLIYPELYNQVVELSETQYLLNQGFENPSEEIHHRLLNFSKSLETFESPTIGKKSVWILN